MASLGRTQTSLLRPFLSSSPGATVRPQRCASAGQVQRQYRTSSLPACLSACLTILHSPLSLLDRPSQLHLSLSSNWVTQLMKDRPSLLSYSLSCPFLVSQEVT